MLSKEQFDNIINDIRKDVYETYVRFGMYVDYGDSKADCTVKINKQLYVDLIDFRNTLPIDYYGRLDHEGYDDATGMDICSDVAFLCMENEDEDYYNFFSMTWIDGHMPIKVVDNVDYDYKVEFSYSVGKTYGMEKPKRKPRRICEIDKSS